MKLYRIFNPNASLTEVYTYVKNHPLKHAAREYAKYVDRFREENPNGSYADFVTHAKKELPPYACELRYTDRGPTGFQYVKVCECDDCESKRESKELVT